jgi:hypothetical protein
MGQEVNDYRLKAYSCVAGVLVCSANAGATHAVKNPRRLTKTTGRDPSQAAARTPQEEALLDYRTARSPYQGTENKQRGEGPPLPFQDDAFAEVARKKLPACGLRRSSDNFFLAAILEPGAS